jgi:hypothetical protein
VIEPAKIPPATARDRREAAWALAFYLLFLPGTCGCCGSWLLPLIPEPFAEPAAFERDLSQDVIGVTSIAMIFLALVILVWRGLRSDERDAPKRF